MVSELVVDVPLQVTTKRPRKLEKLTQPFFNSKPKILFILF